MAGFFNGRKTRVFWDASSWAPRASMLEEPSCVDVAFRLALLDEGVDTLKSFQAFDCLGKFRGELSERYSDEAEISVDVGGEEKDCGGHVNMMLLHIAVWTLDLNNHQRRTQSDMVVFTDISQHMPMITRSLLSFRHRHVNVFVAMPRNSAPTGFGVSVSQDKHHGFVFLAPLSHPSSTIPVMYCPDLFDDSRISENLGKDLLLHQSEWDWHEWDWDAHADTGGMEEERDRKIKEDLYLPGSEDQDGDGDGMEEDRDREIKEDLYLPGSEDLDGDGDGMEKERDRKIKDEMDERESKRNIEQETEEMGRKRRRIRNREWEGFQGSLAMAASDDTCVFWDVQDYPVPPGLDPDTFIQNIKRAVLEIKTSLRKKAEDDVFKEGEVLILAYVVDEESLPPSYHDHSDIRIVPAVADRWERRVLMTLDFVFWKMDNPVPSPVDHLPPLPNLLVISKEQVEFPHDREEQRCFWVILVGLKYRGYNVFFAVPDALVHEGAPSTFTRSVLP